MAEECLGVDILYYILLKHLLADHQYLFLVTAHSFSKPLKNLLAATAHSVLTKPAVFVVLHGDVFVHDVGPFFEILQLIIFDLGLTTSSSVVVFCNFLFFRL